MLRAGIVGLPNVGKSTLFNALTSSKKAESANYPFCTIEPNVGVVTVPDHRLQALKDLVKTTTVIPTAIEFVDIAGLVKGASKGEGLGNQFLCHIRQVDSIIHVVRCFVDSNTVHVNGAIDPIDDIEVINMELALADLATVEKRKEKITKQVKARDKISIAENEVLDKLLEILTQGKPFSNDLFTDEELLIVKSLQLLCTKPVIYAANVSEEDFVQGKNEFVDRVKEYVKIHNSKVLLVSAQIESEIVELSEEEAKEYLNDLGIEGSGIDRMIMSVYELLGLKTFFTAGEKEVRAWTVKTGSKAPEAAGEIHSDIEKGFIRAEVTSYRDFIGSGSYACARDKGLTRLEGKEYIIEDGDIVHFRFAV